MATALTRNTLVSYAGKRAGNESLATFANDWLNNIIDTLAQNYKFPELQKTATGSLASGTTEASAISLPTDFGDLWDVHGLNIVDSAGTNTALMPQPPDWFDLLVDPNAPGTPQWAIFNLNTNKWWPYPVPSVAYTWTLRYRLKPSRLSTDTTIPFANDDIFIQALYVQILQYEGDDRYAAEYAVLQQMINKYLGGFNKSPIKSRAVRFNANAFRNIQNVR